jgi:hypothetical protein
VCPAAVVANNEILGLHGEALNAIEAILTEEQIHYNFAVANGGKPATTHFSFPHGKETFEDRGTFSGAGALHIIKALMVPLIGVNKRLDQP